MPRSEPAPNRGLCPCPDGLRTNTGRGRPNAVCDLVYGVVIKRLTALKRPIDLYVETRIYGLHGVKIPITAKPGFARESTRISREACT